MNKNYIKQITSGAKIVILALFVAIGMNYAFAFVGPTAGAPGENVPAPINVGAADQVKDGGLSVNAFIGGGDGSESSFWGNVEIGSSLAAIGPKDLFVYGNIGLQNFKSTEPENADVSYPAAICTDTLGNIIVCNGAGDDFIFLADGATNTYYPNDLHPGVTGVTVTWSSDSASCTASGALLSWSGTKAGSGVQIISFATNGLKVLNLECGGVTRSVSINVSGPANEHGTKVFTSNGTLYGNDIPYGVPVMIEVWGGGGGGAFTGNGNDVGGGGGAGGSYTMAILPSNNTANEYTVSIGNGGLGGKTVTGITTYDGAPGGQSSVIGGGVTIKAAGGYGAENGLHSSAYLTNAARGVNSISGTVNGKTVSGFSILGGQSEQSEEYACLNEDGGGNYEKQGFGGRGGYAPRGGAGGLPKTLGASAVAGNVPGGGGGGGTYDRSPDCDGGGSPSAGADGAKGMVVVTW